MFPFPLIISSNINIITVYMSTFEDITIFVMLFLMKWKAKRYLSWK